MRKEYYQRQLNALSKRKLTLKATHQNRVNYLKKLLQTENESFQNQLQSILVQEQNLKNAKSKCSK